MRKIIWEVRVLSPPPVMKYCKKCGCRQPFMNSDCFRVNAQRKSLDVWLIYKCSKCDATWNASVFTRVPPQSIPAGLLAGFHENDDALAERYAMDMDFLRRNGAEAGMPEYTIAGDVFSLEEAAELEIKSQYPLPVKVSALVRAKLGLSQKVYSDLVCSGRITGTASEDLVKCRLGKGITLVFSKSSAASPEAVPQTGASQSIPPCLPRPGC